MKTEHRQIKSENGVVHYWISHHKNKTAKCIVFTHGLTANHSMFEKQTEYFSKDYTTLVWDVPLHGLSRPYTNFSYHNAAIELNSILETENISSIILVGMSMGGYPSQEFGILYPEKVEKMIALDTTPFGFSYYSKSDIWWLNHIELMAKWFPENILRKSMAKSVSRTRYSYEKMMDMLRPLSKIQIIEQMGIAYKGFIKENKEVHFSFPVLILAGELDRTGKVKKYCEEWARNTGYPLHYIQRAAHFSNGDNPEQVCLEIKRFIENT